MTNLMRKSGEIASILIWVIGHRTINSIHTADNIFMHILLFVFSISEAAIMAPEDTHGKSTGKITSRLLKSGMISPAILEKLKNEWLSDQNENNADKKPTKPASSHTIDRKSLETQFKSTPKMSVVDSSTSKRKRGERYSKKDRRTK